MASRMDRYKGSSRNSGRSSKNQSLYDEIRNMGTYTNIEGVATIEHANEIDINEVKKLLKNRENYKKQRQAGLIEEQEEIVEEKTPFVEKNYDINAILDKMKGQIKERENNEYRKLSDDQYDFLKKLNAKNEANEIISSIEDEKVSEVKDAVNTIKLSKKALEDTDSGLLDDLKSDTMVGDASSIKSIIDEEKELQENLEDTSTMQLDKSFYTSSFGFTKSDFEELKDMNNKIKKSNKFIIVLLVLLMLGIAGAIIYFIFIK